MATESPNANDGGQSEIAKTKRVFPHSASVGDITLNDEMGDEYDLDGADDVAVLGYEVISTTGDFYVERDWLLTVMDLVGLPEWMAPSETRPHQAWKRARDRLFDGGYDRDDSDEVVSIRYRYEDDVDERNVENVMATVHLPEWYVDEPGGTNTDYTLGVVMYDSDNGKPRFVDKGEWQDGKPIHDTLKAAWEGFQLRFAELFDTHLEGHVGKDINTAFNQYFINQWTDSVQLRPAVYFVPATQELPGYWSDGDAKSMRELIGYDNGDNDRRGWAGLYAYVNDVRADTGQHSAKTEDTEIIRLPVYDNADQRRMVQRKVEAELEEAVTNAVDTILDQMRDSDTVAEDVAANVAERFDSMDATAGNYKAIIQTELAVEEAVGEALAELGEADTDLVRDVLDELDGVET